jgi:CubicO group peptidase (beta-lactamase class C family)
MPHHCSRRSFIGQAGRAGLVLSAFSLLGCSRNQVSSPQSSEEELPEGVSANLEQRILGLMNELRVPGLSIALIKDFRLNWRHSFGFKNAASKEPVDSGTVFEAGSMSKPVFAYLVMKLSEEGLLNLDTPLTKYTPKRFLEGDPRLDQMTARHVLSHTGGFQNWRSKSDPLRIHFTPGEMFLYSGEGYSYLQSVVTDLIGHVNPNDCAKFEADLEVCGTDFDSFMTTRVLQPFAMSSSAYLTTERLLPRTARPHDDKGNTFERSSTSPGVARYGAAGGLNATPTDYAKFLIEVLDPKASDRFRLKKERVEEMLRPQVKVDDMTSWALGWTITHTPQGDVISHGGSNPGFNSFGLVSPKDKSGYVIMTNGDNGAKLIFERLIREEIMQQLAEVS